MRRLRKVHGAVVAHGERVKRTMYLEARPLGNGQRCIEPGNRARVFAEKKSIATLLASAYTSSSKSHLEFLDGVTREPREVGEREDRTKGVAIGALLGDPGLVIHVRPIGTGQGKALGIALYREFGEANARGHGCRGTVEELRLGAVLPALVDQQAIPLFVFVGREGAGEQMRARGPGARCSRPCPSRSRRNPSRGARGMREASYQRQSAGSADGRSSTAGSWKGNQYPVSR